jgi:broad specificity phosphatase PhoE
MLKRIILIRHGQTNWNLAGKYQGHADIGLNATGRAQARMLAGRMRNEKIDAVYSSDRVRAADFAEIVFEGRKIRRNPGLREICFGVFEGLTYNEIVDKYPALSSRWFAKPFGTKIPGGEAPSVFKNRVLRAFRKLSRSGPDTTIAIVTHGGVINIIMSEGLKLNKHSYFVPALAGVNIIEFKKRKAVLKKWVE